MGVQKKLPRSRALAAKLIYSALTILRDNGKEMPMRVLLSKVENDVKLDDWDKERYEKSGYIRWESILHFFSIDCIKAGYLIKKKGIWYITPEGEEVLKLGPEKLLDEATKAYRKWKAEQPIVSVEDHNEVEATEQSVPFDDIEQTALDGLEKFSIQKIHMSFKIWWQPYLEVWAIIHHSLHLKVKTVVLMLLHTEIHWVQNHHVFRFKLSIVTHLLPFRK